MWAFLWNSSYCLLEYSILYNTKYWLWVEASSVKLSCNSVECTFPEKFFFFFAEMHILRHLTGLHWAVVLDFSHQAQLRGILPWIEEVVFFYFLPWIDKKKKKLSSALPRKRVEGGIVIFFLNSCWNGQRTRTAIVGYKTVETCFRVTSTKSRATHLQF